MKTEISYSDDWLQQNDLTGWRVLLNNGKMVYEDDLRPGFIPSSWERLCLHCKETGEYPVNMWIAFRSHVENIGQDKDGYYLYKSILHSPGWEKPQNYYIAGYLEGDILKCKKWKVPEVIVESEFDRDFPGGMTPTFNLEATIRRPGV